MIKADQLGFDDLKTRKTLLEFLDPKSRLRESQELERFQERKI
jgi:hypothetical protein